MITQCEKSCSSKMYTNHVDQRQLKIQLPLTPRLSICKQVTALAEKFQQNWSEQNELESREMDDSLTNLNWLQNVTSIMGPQSPSCLSLMSLNQRNIPSLPRLNQYQKVADSSSPKHSDHAPSHSQGSLTHHLDSALKDGGLLDPSVRYDYKNNWSGKPPFSYATLICMAMRELNKNKITLSDIYGWITDNFIYYRLSDSSWQNSVRHNLSLNKCFEKVPRNKDERGKGGFWRINSKYADRLESNLIKYRRQFPVYSMPQISSGLPAASTLLSRHTFSNHQFYEENNLQQYYHQTATTDDNWNPSETQVSQNISSSPYPLQDGRWTLKNKDDFLQKLPSISHSNAISVCAFNSPLRDPVSQGDSSSMRKAVAKVHHYYRNEGNLKLQSLDEFRTSETGQKVDTQMRTDLTPNQSPTMYSLLHHINSSSSHVSIDDIDSAASSSFDAELTGNSGSCATYHSNSDDHEDSLRFSAGICDDFTVCSDDYLTCDSLRNQDNIFSQFL